MSECLFSVVIACYNHEQFARESVTSALLQKEPGKEVIVVDDCSRDGTAGILKSFGEQIVLACLPVNGGVAAARNHGASLARGEYIVFLDGDDVLTPYALTVYRRLIEERHPKILMALSRKFYGPGPAPEIAQPAGEIQFADYPDFFSKDRNWVYNSSSLIVERAAFQASGGWTPEIFYQDIQDLLNKLGAAGRAIQILSPETVWYRMHTTNAVRKVLPFVEGIYRLLAKAKAGAYPGGREYKGKRAAWFGGLIYYWAKEAIRTGHVRQGLKLFAIGFWMILLAVVRRGAAVVIGRRPVEAIPME